MDPTLPRGVAGMSRRKQDVDALLADLSLDLKDSSSNSRKFSGPTRPGSKTPTNRPPTDAQSLLDDLEGLVQRRRLLLTDSVESSNVASGQQQFPSPDGSHALTAVEPETGSRPSAASGQKKGESLSSNQSDSTSNAPILSKSDFYKEPSILESGEVQTNTSEDTAKEPYAKSSWSKWGVSGQWGTFLSTASKYAGQARHELERRTAAVVQATEENVKKSNGPTSSTEQPLLDLGKGFASRVRGFVQESGLDQMSQNLTAAGRKGWNELVNAVILPMEVHDAVAVTVSHGTLQF